MFAFCLSLSRNVLLAGSIRWEVVLDDGALMDEEEEKDIEKGLDCVRLWAIVCVKPHTCL